METISKSELDTKSVEFWGTVLSYGARAVGALYNEFTSNSLEAQVFQGQVGPIKISENNDKEVIASNTADFSVSLHFASTDNSGSVKACNFMIKANQVMKLDNALTDNLTGSVAWCKFDNNGTYSTSENGNPSGKLMLSVKFWAKGDIYLADDLKLKFSTSDNYFRISSTESTYSNIEIMVVTLDGSVYNFGPIGSVSPTKSVSIDYPTIMDSLLPIPVITFSANIDEAGYNRLLKK